MQASDEREKQGRTGRPDVLCYGPLSLNRGKGMLQRKKKKAIGRMERTNGLEVERH